MILKNLLLMVVLGFSTSLFGSVNSAKEADLKAAYIYNFARYTKWTVKDMNRNQFVICVHKESDLYASLKKLEKKKMKGKTIKVVAVGEGKNCLRPCHMVILPKLQEKRLQALVSKAVASHVLSISDTEGYAQKGVTINLKKVSNKMTFEVNLEQVEHSKLKMSSNLLKMATIVRNK